MLPPEAGRLLAVMFRGGRVCRRSVAALAREGAFNKAAVDRLLYALTAARFVSKHPVRQGAVVTYRLLRPSRRQP
jgi:hypothetical protein